MAAPGSAPGSLRQAGRYMYSQEGVRRGKTPGTNKTSCSIPTKFETILYHPTEHHGFTSSSTRFGRQRNASDEAPGPAAYSPPSTVGKPSQSRRDKGSFASREQRWFEAGFPAFNLPAPGDYRASSMADRPARVEGPSAAFAPKIFEATYEDNLLAKQASLPGPLSYHPEEFGSMGSHAMHTTASASLRSTGPRIGFVSGGSPLTDRRSSPTSARSPLSSHHRMHRSPLEASGEHSPPGFSTERVQPFSEVPRADRPPPDPFSAAFRSGSQRASYSMIAAGPGPVRAKDTEPVDRNTLPPPRPGLKPYVEHCSASFSSALDRFGNPVHLSPTSPSSLQFSSNAAAAGSTGARNGGLSSSSQAATPAPGAYFKMDVVAKAPISSSFFLSSVPKSSFVAPLGGKGRGSAAAQGRREEVVVAAAAASHILSPTTSGAAASGSVRVPGPAYYQPKLPSRKSFHLNLQRSWL